MSGAVNAARQKKPEFAAAQQQSQPVQPKQPSMQSFLGKLGGRPAEVAPPPTNNMADRIRGAFGAMKGQQQPPAAPPQNVFQRMGSAQPQSANNVFQRPAGGMFGGVQRAASPVANVFQRPQPQFQAPPGGSRFNPQMMQSANQVQPARPQPMSAAGAAAQRMMSDEDEKETGGDSDGRMKQFLDHITNNTYVYKNPEKPGANDDVNDGPMAQDFEKSDVGRKFVGETGDGTKMVDANPRLTLVNTAAAAHLNDRLKKLEKKEEDDED